MTRLRTGLWLATLAMVSGGVAGCQKEAPAKPAPQVHAAQAVQPPGGPAPAAKDALSAAPTGPKGAIDGVVTFEGTPPAPAAASAMTDPACQGAAPEAAVTIQDGKLANVLVRISDASLKVAGPAAPVVVHQKGCQYTPRVQGAVLGQKLAIQNQDPTLHNVHTYEDRKSLFNNAQPPGAPPILKPLPDREGVVQVKCDVHPWMAAFVVVGHNPYFAVTDAAGHFHIPDVPPGHYTLEAWQEALGTKTATVEVKADQTAQAAFQFAAAAK